MGWPSGRSAIFFVRSAARTMSIPRALLGLKRFLGAARRLPEAVAASLHPRTLLEASILESQLDVVQASLRRLDWVLPFAGAAVAVTVYSYGIPPRPMLAYLTVLVLACLLNEYFLARELPKTEDPIERASRRAKSVSISAVMLVSVWCVTVLSM